MTRRQTIALAGMSRLLRCRLPGHMWHRLPAGGCWQTKHTVSWGAVARHTAALLALLFATAPGIADDWWDAKWDYRARLDCPAGAGDVAYATINTAGRTAEDGCDLRLVDSAGRLRPFEILHHDPQLATLICFQVPPGEASSVWLYYGNSRARPIETNYPTRKSQHEARERWEQVEQERQRIIGLRRPQERRLHELRRKLDEAESAGQEPTARSYRQQIARIEEQLADIGPVPENPRPTTTGPWQRHRGVLLRTYRKAKETHPATLREFNALKRHSEAEGAAFRGAISDGFNPFGTSDNYLSEYDGFLQIPDDGEYGFCTVSDDGSWLYINDRLIVEWPGSHRFEEGAHGEKNGTLRLKQGIAHIRYYHEEGTGGQMAYVAWKPPGAERFAPIPRRQWLSVREASAGAYQPRRAPLMAVPDVQVLHTFWAPDSEGLQATMLQCEDHSYVERGEIESVRWSFADGLEADGPSVQHALFRTGRPTITLTVTDRRGREDSITCAPRIFQVDVVAAYFRYGSPEEYQQSAADYDVEHMNRDDLDQYARFWNLVEDWPQHARAADAFVRRFPDHADAPSLAATGAKAYLDPGIYDAARADQLLRTISESTERTNARRRARLDRAHLLAWHLGQPAAARSVYDEIYAAVEDDQRKGPRIMARECLIGVADVALLEGQYEQAERGYRDVPPVERRTIELPELLSKTGGNAYVVDDLIRRGEYEWARRALDRWEDEFPVQKLEGYTFFLRGKVLFIEAPGELALRYLELAESVAPKAVHVPEAVWLRANCLMALGRYEEAALQFTRIAHEFTYSEFFGRVDEKLRECREAMEDAPPPE